MGGVVGMGWYAPGDMNRRCTGDLAIRSVILSEASRGFIARSAVEEPALSEAEWDLRFQHSRHSLTADPSTAASPPLRMTLSNNDGLDAISDFLHSMICTDAMILSMRTSRLDPTIVSIQ
jgi:hypothetical protein